MKKLLQILIPALLISGCITEKNCFKRFPPKIETKIIVKDTTIVTEKTRFDTIFHLTKEISRDTIYFTDSKTEIKIKYIKLPGDSILIEAECPADTIFIEGAVTETITSTETSKPPLLDLGKLLFWLILLIAAIVTLYLLKRFI